MEKLEECEKHIRHTHADMKGQAWCGEKVSSFDWTFISIDHAAYSNLGGSGILPCPACVKKVVETLQKT